ncbi:MAG: glycosyltransferase family 4 protein [Blastocatellia bacterium]|nr:glycosyltransferase family 4 protein [Blastocatellia bacterium]
MLIVAVILILVFAVSYFGVLAYRSFSLKRGLLDHPNERSSHEMPTPRGGGLVMAFVAIFGYVALSLAYNTQISYGYILAALIVIVVGFLDDVFSVWFLWRLIGQFAAAAIFVSISGSFGSIYVPFFGEVTFPAVVSVIVTSLYIVYFLNAYNFMDGIDGIAGLQALVAAIFWQFIAASTGMYPAMHLGGSLAAASLGFLLLNWQPAKIFMGDAGSSFLGFSFAVLPIVALDGSASGNGLPLTVGLLVVWPFVFDSLITLVRRTLRGEKVWSAHREHLYQRLVIGGWSHARVTTIYGVLALLSSVVAATYALNTPYYLSDLLAVTVAIVSCAVVFWLSAKYGRTA